MTIRDELNRHKQHLMTVYLIGPALLVGAVVLAEAWLFPALPFLVSAGAFCAIYCFYFINKLRCANCGILLNHLVLRPSWHLLTIDPRIHYCPFCGSDIDTELVSTSDERIDSNS